MQFVCFGPACSVLACIAVSAISVPALGAEGPSVPAFPGAEGYGASTRGGRGGAVIAVTNLDDSGPGSLRAAIQAKGPRTIVFRVSGTIDLKSKLDIRNPYVTIAGQTAPGDGICIKGWPLSIGADEVIVRHLRVRFGTESGTSDDAIQSRFKKNIIIDHVSASWSVDEAMSFYHGENTTVQWCIISESLNNGHHEKGGPHGFGGIWGGDKATFHHNLIAHNSSRNPRIASGAGLTDIRNNVIYNWGYNSTYGGEKSQVKAPQFADSQINLVANYYKPGPATVVGPVRYRIANPWSRNGTEDLGKWYIADNVMDGNSKVTADNWDGGVQADKTEWIESLRVREPFSMSPIRSQTATEAYEAVLNDAGATLPKRDSVDARVIDETRAGTATYEGPTYRQDKKLVDPSKPTGIIDSPEDVGGWPELKSEPAPADTDGDGMPDAWESQHGLNPNDAADGAQDKDADGYTNLEEYLNGTDPAAFVDYTKPENNVVTSR